MAPQDQQTAVLVALRPILLSVLAVQAAAVVVAALAAASMVGTVALRVRQAAAVVAAVAKKASADLEVIVAQEPLVTQ